MNKPMKIRTFYISIFLFMLASLASMAQPAKSVSKQVFVDNPGTLISQFTLEEANNITHLIITGKINAIDFKHLRDEFGKLEILDLSNADIRMYSGKAGTYPDGFYMYLPNFIPAYAFCTSAVGAKAKGKLSLREVILSEKTVNIEDCAFKGCENLLICKINKKKAPNLLPEGLSDSTSVVFIPVGCTDTYRRKDRWADFDFVEGDPKFATLKIGEKESLQLAVQRAELQPQEINFLTIEGKLDAEDFALIRDYMPNLVTVDISKTNATSIPDFTFTQKKYLFRITLPHALRSIGQRVFSNCTKLSGTLILPPTVTSIEYGAFMGCNKLNQVVATGNRISTVGENLFGEKTNSRLIYKKK